jgi:hypothetical protein
MHNMLMCNITSKVLQFQDLIWYILQEFIYIYINIYGCMLNIISNIIFYMSHDFILQHIKISISTLSKYVRVKKHKTTKNAYLYRVVPPPGTNAPLPRRRGKGHLYQASHHLYQMVCTGWIPSTNEGYQPVQMSIFQ